MLINFPYTLFHTYSLILSSPYPSSLTLSSHFQQYFPRSCGYMFGSLLSYKHVLLGHLLATSQELTFLSLFPCLKLMPSAYRGPALVGSRDSLGINLQLRNFQKYEHASGPRKEPEAVSSHQMAACPLSRTLQLCCLAPPLPSPVCNSSCLFTQRQPLCASFCAVLPYFAVKI